MPSNTLRSRGKPLFGEAAAPTPKSPVNLAEELNRRLAAKYQNYERAAARLELRGEHDAAKVLRRAAGRLRLLRNQPAHKTSRC